MYKKTEPETIQTLFASIAQNYDRANTTMTLGLHKKWNKELIALFSNTHCLLDLCAGTGEIAFGFLKQNPQSRAILLDFCQEMLFIAQKKGRAFSNRFEILKADAQEIPLPNSSVDGVSISYGIRNVKEPELCFAEVYRVLSNGGRFGILELTRPTSPLMRFGHRLYTHLILPMLGKMAAKNKKAYQYLASSVDTFTAPESLESSLKKVGFQQIQRRPLMGGTVTLFSALKIGDQNVGSSQ